MARCRSEDAVLQGVLQRVLERLSGGRESRRQRQAGGVAEDAGAIVLRGPPTNSIKTRRRSACRTGRSGFIAERSVVRFDMTRKRGWWTRGVLAGAGARAAGNPTISATGDVILYDHISPSKIDGPSRTAIRVFLSGSPRLRCGCRVNHDLDGAVSPASTATGTLAKFRVTLPRRRRTSRRPGPTPVCAGAGTRCSPSGRSWPSDARSRHRKSGLDGS